MKIYSGHSFKFIWKLSPTSSVLYNNDKTSSDCWVGAKMNEKLQMNKKIIAHHFSRDFFPKRFGNKQSCNSQIWLDCIKRKYAIYETEDLNTPFKNKVFFIINQYYVCDSKWFSFSVHGFEFESQCVTKKGIWLWSGLTLLYMLGLRNVQENLFIRFYNDITTFLV